MKAERETNKQEMGLNFNTVVAFYFVGLAVAAYGGKFGVELELDALHAFFLGVLFVSLLYETRGRFLPRWLRRFLIR